MPISTTVTTMVDGVITEHTVAQVGNIMPIIANMINIFLLRNIPTAILLVIYAICRNKQSRKRALDKMSIQDLE